MYLSLPSLVPNADDLLALEVEELAGVLLVYLNGCEGNTASGVFQNGLLSQQNFFNSLDHQPTYPGKQAAVSRALMEAWSWLQGEGLLVRHPDQPAAWFFLSRRAKRLHSLEDYASFRNASVLPKAHLHPLIATKVYPAFLRGEYDTAVFQAFWGGRNRRPTHREFRCRSSRKGAHARSVSACEFQEPWRRAGAANGCDIACR
jgi:hypothetical protein